MLLTTQPTKTCLNVSKITKEHESSHLCSNVILLTLSRFSRAGYKQKNSEIIEIFLKKDIKGKTSLKGICCCCCCCCNIPPKKNELCSTENNLTCSIFQNSYFAKFLHQRPPWFLTSSFSHTEYNICFL